MFARTPSLTPAWALTLAFALAWALPAAAAPQQYSLSSHQAANRSSLGEAGTLGANAVNLSSLGVAAGTWTDPASGRAGAMTGQLVDATGALRFEVHAALTETPLGGFEPRKRYGKIRGQLLAAEHGPRILMSGSWRLQNYTNLGDFQASLFVQGPTPLAPVLYAGSLDGKLMRPHGASGSLPAAVASTGSASSGQQGLGLSARGAPGRSALAEEPRPRTSSAPARVHRTFVGRWDMPLM